MVFTFRLIILFAEALDQSHRRICPASLKFCFGKQKFQSASLRRIQTMWRSKHTTTSLHLICYGKSQKDLRTISNEVNCSDWSVRLPVSRRKIDFHLFAQLLARQQKLKWELKNLIKF